MRKLIESSFMSLDGVVGSPELLAPHWDAENKQYALDDLAECEAFVFGRKTYDMFAARWSAIRGDAYYDKVNALPKYVASRTLTAAGENAKILQGDVGRAIAALKEQPGKHLIKYGCGDLDRTLLEHGLIDEFRFAIFPIVLGQGRRLFEGYDMRALGLQLTHTKVFANGVIRATYVPKSRT
jgi:dihydrofolate reductase